MTFAGVLQSIRDATTGLLYWLVRGIFWVGIVFLFLGIFGLTGWLINSVLLPQIQKQITLDLINRQRGLLPYIRLLLVAWMLVAGIEIGFFMTPFGQFAPKDLWGLILEIFIVTPTLVLIAWWYLAYIRFISLRVSATQIGKIFSSRRSRFIKTASGVWVFLFFIPGFLLSRYLTGDLLETFLYASVLWLIFAVLFSPVLFSGSWAIIKLFFEKQPKNCPHCGRVSSHITPAIESCEHCDGVLGEWLFVPE